MKTLIPILGILSIGFSARAQSQFTVSDNLTYAVIKDPDGYVNVRKDANINAPIAGKINNYSIFSCEPNDKSNWWKVIQVDEHDKSYWLEGYIYKDRVSLLPAHWKSVNKKSIHADSCVLKTDSATIIIRETAFNPKKHKLLFESKELIHIDGKLFWGTDGEIPKVRISVIKVSKNNLAISIPESAFNDLYEPHLQTLSATTGPGNTFYVMMSNSDGAGGYSVIWIFKDGKYLNRYIDDSED
jgi:hypothetical protein